MDKVFEITVRVKPASKKGSLVQPSLTGELLVYTSEPAIDGRANKAVIGLLADFYEVPKSNVEIVRGHKSRIKTVRISL